MKGLINPAHFRTKLFGLTEGQKYIYDVHSHDLLPFIHQIYGFNFFVGGILPESCSRPKMLNWQSPIPDHFASGPWRLKI